MIIAKIFIISNHILNTQYRGNQVQRTTSTSFETDQDCYFCSKQVTKQTMNNSSQYMLCPRLRKIRLSH